MVINNRRKILVSMTAILIGFASLLPQFTFNDRFVEYFDDRMNSGSLVIGPRTT